MYSPFALTNTCYSDPFHPILIYVHLILTNAATLLMTKRQLLRGQYTTSHERAQYIDWFDRHN